jgi:hypothetical protein
MRFRWGKSPFLDGHERRRYLHVHHIQAPDQAAGFPRHPPTCGSAHLGCGVGEGICLSLGAGRSGGVRMKRVISVWSVPAMRQKMPRSHLSIMSVRSGRGHLFFICLRLSRNSGGVCTTITLGSLSPITGRPVIGDGSLGFERQRRRSGWIPVYGNP